VQQTSATISETHLQHLEHDQKNTILIKHQIIGYFKYVDDIIIYDKNKTHTDTMGMEFKAIHPTINFALEN
jgi:energy-coupling factor transporter ATP-binding protein EcfA2